MFTSFRCPKCRGQLLHIGSSLVCENRHTYDIAREGYVNLEPHRHDSGDDRGMCVSRRAFLSGGYYQRLADYLMDMASLCEGDRLVDLGCGEGWYLHEFATKHPLNRFCGIDLSKTAIKMASSREKQLQRHTIDYAVAGIFSLPCPDEFFSAALSVFAPICSEEAYRVLKPGGAFIVASPGEKHLEGLKALLYEQATENEMKDFAPDGFTLTEDSSFSYSISLTQPAICDLFAMTPYYWKTSRDAAARLAATERLDTEVAFRVRKYIKQ